MTVSQRDHRAVNGREARQAANGNNRLEAALNYRRCGWMPVPVHPMDKSPIGEGWQKLRLDEADIPHYFNDSQNVGILLGEPSGGLVDIDLDCDEAITLADTFLPPTDSIFGRPSTPSSHRLYVAKAPPDGTEQFRDPVNKEMLVELRSTGGQTVFPPSIHPSGEQIAFAEDGEPTPVDGPTLRSLVARLAAATLLTRHWPRVNGSRQDIALALAGGLSRAGWDEEDVAGFIGAVADTAGEEEAPKRAEASRHTAQRLAQDLPITGWPRLAELLDDKVVEAVCKWLGIQRRAWGEQPSSARGGGKGQVDDDVGMTKLLADAITCTDSFAQDAGGRLYVYADGVHRPDGEKRIRQRVKALLVELGLTIKWSTHRAEQVVEYIRTDAPVLWERPPLDTVNVRNGLLNVNTVELLPHTPEFLSPIQLPIVFDATAECPAWERFVSEVFPADAADAGVPWEIAAWLMTPDTSVQKAILLLGEGSNGKSAFLTALSALIGTEHIANLSLHKLETERFSAARLVGKLANICPDLPSTHLTSTSTFKALTGGDRIAGEYKYRDSFEFTPYARLIFSANNPPRSDDATHAFFRRWVVIPFERTFEGDEQIPRRVLDARLADPKELSGVLNKALAVLSRVRERGITETDAMRRAWNEFKSTTDPFTVWLSNNIIERPDLSVTKQALHQAYNSACERAGRPGLAANSLTRALKRLRSHLQEAQRTVAGRVQRVWLGIGLAAPDADPPSQLSRVSRVSPICFDSADGRAEGVVGRSDNNGKKPVKLVNAVNVTRRADGEAVPLHDDDVVEGEERETAANAVAETGGQPEVVSASLSTFTVRPIAKHEAADLVVKHHYLHRKPPISLAFGLFDGQDRPVGVITYGVPPSHTLLKGLCGPEEMYNVYELNRLWLRDNEPNQASFFIAETLRRVDREIIVSFADTAEGHVGFTYQAANWLYTGLSAPFRDPKVRGREHQHHATYAYGLSAQEVKEKFGSDVYWVDRPRKHRYVYLNAERVRRRELLAKLRYPIIPYPKSWSVAEFGHGHDEAFVEKLAA